MTDDGQEEQAKRRSDARVVRWVRVAVWSAWGALILWIMASAVGESPVQPSRSARTFQLSLIPERWAFFTRNPREPQIVVYRVVGRRMIRLTFTNTSARNLFGLSRSARAFDAEVTGLLAPVLASTWTDCRGDPLLCALEPGGHPLELTNWSPTRFVCGDVVFVQSPPVPWAWSGSLGRIHMPSKILRARVDCGHTLLSEYRR